MRVNAKDRHFAVISFAVQLEHSGNVEQALAEICSEAITTKSNLLIHQVLISMDEGKKWTRFVNEVKRYIAERATR